MASYEYTVEGYWDPLYSVDFPEYLVQMLLGNITSEHSDKPHYVQMVESTCRPSAELINLYESIPGLYDVDVAVGPQLDTVGRWVGISRNLDIPLTGVYFALDTTGVGFDQGVWMGPYDPVTGLTSLPDDYYRLLIKVKILNNHWNGTKSDAYILANEIFGSLGYIFFIEDLCNLTINFGLIGSGPPSGMAQALLTSGKFNIKPATIQIANYFYQSVPGPIFAFDINNTQFAGLDVGGWATVVHN